MHGHSRQPDTVFALEESQLEYIEHVHAPRRYSSSSTSSSDYWGYTSVCESSSYSSPPDTSLDYIPPDYVSPQRYPSSRAWSNNSVDHMETSSLPRTIDSYNTSLRSTDLRHQPTFKVEVNMWSTSQISPYWPETRLPRSSIPLWNGVAMPSIDPSETKPNIYPNHHYTLHGSCSPVSTVSKISSSSPSPSPVVDGAPKLGRRPNPKASSKICYHCHATSTPLWRREPSTLRTLCNACGLYLQQRNKLRPQELIDADAEPEDDKSDISDQDSEHPGPQCTHCRTRHTSVWRRSKAGAQLCNACGVYARLRGKDRPLSLKRKKIKPRTKHAKPMAGKN
ncbi:MAG: hypothetical protein NXY57DRAFT_180595 [Lentinula lateritia]|nr:MAG: hypothetical protein NXY57DRAFT_180595 [Lentinula lateritia]